MWYPGYQWFIIGYHGFIMVLSRFVFGFIMVYHHLPPGAYPNLKIHPDPGDQFENLSQKAQWTPGVVTVYSGCTSLQNGWFSMLEYQKQHKFCESVAQEVPPFPNSTDCFAKKFRPGDASISRNKSCTMDSEATSGSIFKWGLGSECEKIPNLAEMFPCPGWEHQSIWIYLAKGHHISLTWIVGPFGDDFPIKTAWFQASGGSVRSLPRGSFSGKSWHHGAIAGKPGGPSWHHWATKIAGIARFVHPHKDAIKDGAPLWGKSRSVGANSYVK